MIKYTKNSFKNYIQELNSVDLIKFNQFIFKNILAHSLKVNTIVPIMVAMGVVAFSIAIQDTFYVFIPQSSITSFASYVIFACITSILVLLLYPLIIIITINYIGHKLKNILARMFLPFKILVLILCFYLCVRVVMTGGFSEEARLYVAGLWVLLYFLLINIYITAVNNGGTLKFVKFRVLFALIFIGLFVKPFLFMFLYTSEMINYTSINSELYLNKINCSLINTSIAGKGAPTNLTVNNPKYYKETTDGCYVYGNSVRYGFGSDYVIIFKKNLAPFTNKKGKEYNAYVRLTCYSGNCYASDNIYTLHDQDSVAELIRIKTNLQDNRIHSME